MKRSLRIAHFTLEAEDQLTVSTDKENEWAMNEAFKRLSNVESVKPKHLVNIELRKPNSQEILVRITYWGFPDKKQVSLGDLAIPFSYNMEEDDDNYWFKEVFFKPKTWPFMFQFGKIIDINKLVYTHPGGQPPQFLDELNLYSLLLRNVKTGELTQINVDPVKSPHFHLAVSRYERINDVYSKHYAVELPDGSIYSIEVEFVHGRNRLIAKARPLNGRVVHTEIVGYEVTLYRTPVREEVLVYESPKGV